MRGRLGRLKAVIVSVRLPVTCSLKHCRMTPEKKKMKKKKREEKRKGRRESRRDMWLLISMDDDSRVNTHLQAVPERSLASRSHLSF